jgi:predicted nucleic acid-binding protein
MLSRVISNATPLIYLAKADRLSLLYSVFEEVLIPGAVYEEVVLKGKRTGQTDAFLVEKSIEEGRISVRRVQRTHPVSVPLHPGEVEVISLAVESGIETLLIDDARGRATAEMAGLKPRGTLWLILRAVKENLLSFDGFLATLEAMARHGFYLREDLFLRAIREARRLSVEGPKTGD